MTGFLEVTWFGVVEVAGRLAWRTSYGNGDVEDTAMHPDAATMIRRSYATFPVSALTLVRDGLVTRDALRDRIGYLVPLDDA